MPTDLQNWLPSKILEVSENPAGFIVDDEEWNRRWNLHRAQGDDTSQCLYDALQQLYTTAWHPTAGAVSIKNPAIDAESGDNVSSQLTWAANQLSIAFQTLAQHTAEIDLRRRTDVAITHAETTGRDLADCHPISAITDLENRLQSIQAGALEAVAHNLLPSRDVADAHPTSAITGLDDALLTLTNDLATQENRIYTSAEITHGASTVSQKFANIDATIASITGDIGEITHNDLAGRDAVNGHPISAVTGLQAALDAIAVTYQPKVLHGTTVPLDTLGNDGDIYIRISA
jgi:hypothetical protein